MPDDRPPPGGPAPRDRRRSARHQIIQRCWARPAGRGPADGRPEGWRCIVYDVSATGVGVALPFRPAAGTDLEVEPHGVPGAGPVRARVVYARPLEHLWLCGCELAAPLSAGELRAWVAAGQTPWADAATVDVFGPGPLAEDRGQVAGARRAATIGPIGRDI